MKLFNRKNKKEETVKKMIEETEELITIELAFTEEEAEIVKYFNLKSNFTKKDLAEAAELKMIEKNKEALETDQTVSQIEEKISKYKKILEFYLVKRKDFTEAIKEYSEQYNSEDKLINYDNSLGGNIKSVITGTQYLLEEYEKQAMKAKTIEKSEKYKNDFISNSSVIIDLIRKDKLKTVEDIQEYLKTTKETHDTVKSNIQEFYNGIEEAYKKNKNFDYSSYGKTAKEDLIKDLRKIIVEERFIKRGTQIYYDTITSLGELEKLDDFATAKKTYDIAIEKIAKSLSEPQNNFSYSPDSNPPKTENADDETLTDENGKLIK